MPDNPGHGTNNAVELDAYIVNCGLRLWPTIALMYLAQRAPVVLWQFDLILSVNLLLSFCLFAIHSRQRMVIWWEALWIIHKLLISAFVQFMANRKWMRQNNSFSISWYHLSCRLSWVISGFDNSYYLDVISCFDVQKRGRGLPGYDKD